MVDDDMLFTNPVMRVIQKIARRLLGWTDIEAVPTVRRSVYEAARALESECGWDVAITVADGRARHARKKTARAFWTEVGYEFTRHVVFDPHRVIVDDAGSGWPPPEEVPRWYERWSNRRTKPIEELSPAMQWVFHKRVHFGVSRMLRRREKKGGGSR